MGFSMVFNEIFVNFIQLVTANQIYQFTMKSGEKTHNSYSLFEVLGIEGIR